MLVRTDARRRIKLPSTLNIKPGDALDLQVLDDGCIILVPVEPIPRHQLWAWTTETKEAVAASLADPRPSLSAASAKEAEEIAKRWVGEE